MLKRGILLAVFTFVFSAVVVSGAAASPIIVKRGLPNFLSLFDGPKALVTQNLVGDTACGPTALFYAFKLGNDKMRQAYQKLPGETDGEKLKNLVHLFGAKPSQVSFHHLRLEPSDGMAPKDLFATASDFIAMAGNLHPELKQAPTFSLDSRSLRRLDGEVKAGAFVRRVHTALKNSLLKDVPVVVNLVPFLAEYKKSTDTNQWTEHNGHYVVVIGVPDALDDDALGFPIEYLDPETGKSKNAYVYEETVRSFWAKQDRPDGTGEWIHPEVKQGNENISSPYLEVTAPGLDLVPSNAKDAQRVVLTLMSAVGSFSDQAQVKPL